MLTERRASGSLALPSLVTRAFAQMLYEKGQPGGYASLNDDGIVPDDQLPAYAPLDDNGMVPSTHLPAFLLGSLVYKGTWNATTNSPAIPAASAGNLGWFYEVAVAGTTTIDGVSVWALRDRIVSNGATWQRVLALDLASIGSIGAGSAASPSIAFAQGVGLYSAAAYELDFAAREVPGFIVKSPAATGKDDLYGGAGGPAIVFGSPDNIDLVTPGGNEHVSNFAYYNESGYLHTLSIKMCDPRGDAPELAIDRVAGHGIDGVTTFDGLVQGDGLGYLYWRGLDDDGHLEPAAGPPAYGRSARIGAIATQSFTTAHRGASLFFDVCKTDENNATTWGWISPDHNLVVRAGDNSPDPESAFGDATIHLMGQGFGSGVNLILGNEGGLVGGAAAQISKTGASALALNRTFDSGGILSFFYKDTKYNSILVDDLNNVGWEFSVKAPGRYTDSISISDDTAIDFTPPSATGFILLEQDGGGNYALLRYRTDTPSMTDVATRSANVNLATGVLAGTTGTDAKLTVSAHTNGKVYVENRLGLTITLTYIIFDK